MTTDLICVKKYISLLHSDHSQSSPTTAFVTIPSHNTAKPLFIYSGTNLKLKVNMIVPKTLVILATALTATATKVHNQFGHNGWIQEDRGSDVALNNKGSATI